MSRLNEIRILISEQLRSPELRTRVLSLIKASESPRGFALIAATGLSLVALGHMIGGGESSEPSPENAAPAIAEEMTVPEHTASGESKAAPVADEPITAPVEQVYRLRRGETLIGLMHRAGISNQEANRAVHALRDVADLRRLQQGQEIRIATSPEGTPKVAVLRMRDSFDQEAVLTGGDDGFNASRVDIPTVGLTHLVEGEITDSLYLSAQRAGLPTPVIVELIRLMSFDVDFEREIREGDRFQVYFERRYAPSFGDLAEGRILQLKLELQKRTLEATYHEDKDGQSDYFDADGNSTRKTLMKTPLDVTVVTSSYGKRKHPVLGYTRMHKGVDFRARTGTPIMAAGDGVVERASRYGSYGNYIRIKHNSTYQTAYAHLSRYGKGIKAGARVKQGQIIGYAGATGRVNAAHLHYEVMVNGQQANPLTLKLPTGRKLEGEELAAFQARHTVLLADIEQVQAQQRLLQMADAAPQPGSLSAETEEHASAQAEDR